MHAINWPDVIQVLLSSGVLVQGLAAVRWVLKVEQRVSALEAGASNA